MSGAYEGRQIVGMDLHRRRSVLVRMTDTGEQLETVRISNDPEYLTAGDGPRRGGTRGGAGSRLRLVLGRGHPRRARRHGALAHPLGVKMFSYRRVKNDQRDAADLADLLRMGRLPEAWIAPPATRELRGWVRHRAKLVGLRSSLKCQVHGVLAHAGIWVPMSDLFGVAGPATAGRAVGRATGWRSSPARGWTPRCGSSPRWSSRSSCSPSWSTAGCAPTPATGRSSRSPGSGRCWPRCSSPRSATSPASTDPQQLASWAGLTPKHHESDTTVHRGRITKQGSRLVRWAAVEAMQRVAGHTRPGATPGPGRRPPWPQHRRRGRRPGTAHSGLLRAARPPHPRPQPAAGRAGDQPTGGMRPPRAVVGAGRAGHDPRLQTAWSPH